MEQVYNTVVGYSPLDKVNKEKIRQSVLNNRAIIETYYKINEYDTILVAGMGNGEEAVAIADIFNLKTCGVDISYEDGSLTSDNTLLECKRDDLMNLSFPDNFFSIVYSSHVLEHVNDHLVVLSELSRVMKNNSVLFIGFPNKSRLLGYISSHQKISLWEKVKWNFNDYVQKIKGKFENKFGAHAGFSEKEFIKDASNFFNKIYPVRNQYMLLKHSKHKTLINFLIKTKLEEYIFPSNYYICIK